MTFDRNIFYFDQGVLLGGPLSLERPAGRRWDMKNNIYWCEAGKSFTFKGKSWDQWRAMGRDKEGSVIADPKFVDPDNYDFRFASDGVIKQTGFQPFDYTEGRACTAMRPGSPRAKEWYLTPRSADPARYSVRWR